ncbi:MAG: lipid-A-disaccharide synthase [Dysgonamonadaceae bacterium]|jgi:lipid-A-disaccharide synthase|nr:lipid-A-disaccharide synthase [Dysgonamonadaceae bacterium]
MRYFIVAGEASGDLHASGLMKALIAGDNDAKFCFFGGNLMESVGGRMLRHYREMAFMGFVPVLLHLPKILLNMIDCRRAIRDFSPDCVILVDYPGFNLRIARYVKNSLHIPVIYYISPTVWAWKRGRIKTVKKYVDRMLCILPFEPEFYKRNGYLDAVYVGNPTVDAVALWAGREESFEEFSFANALSGKPVIAILAGSRRQEIRDNLPSMLEAASDFVDCQLVIAGAPSVEAAFYEQVQSGCRAKATVVYGQTYRLLRQSRAALVTSGTATLEAALLRVPQVVCYRTRPKHIAAFIWKHFFDVEYISLVNLIAGREVVVELFNERFSVERIGKELHRLLHDGEHVRAIQEGYDEVDKRLCCKDVSIRAAEVVFSFLAHRSGH